MISDDRKKHIFGVANFLKKYAEEQKLQNEEIKALYTLGLLHDIGYEFLEEKDYRKHNIVGGEFLREQGYKYWQEVYYHSTVNPLYKSRFLDLLNWADGHIDNTGNYVSFEDRLKDISIRYNVPIEKLEIYHMVEELKQKGFK